MNQNKPKQTGTGKITKQIGKIQKINIKWVTTSHWSHENKDRFDEVEFPQQPRFKQMQKFRRYS